MHERAGDQGTSRPGGLEVSRERAGTLVGARVKIFLQCCPSLLLMLHPPSRPLSFRAWPDQSEPSSRSPTALSGSCGDTSLPGCVGFWGELLVAAQLNSGFELMVQGLRDATIIHIQAGIQTSR